jgi:hypothetical protein
VGGEAEQEGWKEKARRRMKWEEYGRRGGRRRRKEKEEKGRRKEGKREAGECRIKDIKEKDWAEK